MRRVEQTVEIAVMIQRRARDSRDRRRAEEILSGRTLELQPIARARGEIFDAAITLIARREAGPIVVETRFRISQHEGIRIAAAVQAIHFPRTCEADPEAAHQHVVAFRALQEIVPSIAGEEIRQRVADAAQRAPTEFEVFDIRAERVVGKRQHRIDAGAGIFDDHVRDRVDDVAIVAQAAGEHIGAAAAIEHVG